MKNQQQKEVAVSWLRIWTALLNFWYLLMPLKKRETSSIKIKPVLSTWQCNCDYILICVIDSRDHVRLSRTPVLYAQKSILNDLVFPIILKCAFSFENVQSQAIMEKRCMVIEWIVQTKKESGIDVRVDS